MLDYIKEVLENRPADWLNLTTHRLDIYEEELAKTQFLEEFEALFKANNATQLALAALPTAYDYIRLGHPLSCVLEWAIATRSALHTENVISFSSKTMPLFAILRENRMQRKATRIIYKGALPLMFDADLVKRVYGYLFELKRVDDTAVIPAFDGSTIVISQEDGLAHFNGNPAIDFFIAIRSNLGSILMVNGEHNAAYIPAIQHVRRRETVAMTPANCLTALQLLTGQTTATHDNSIVAENKAIVLKNITTITGAPTQALVGSSGLSVQYAIMMGLVQDALENHKGKAIKFVVPPNCYGGTNDQARRVAACTANVSVVDLPVDGDNDMVKSVDTVLNTIAKEDAVPYIIAEIPTNPRVEVPDLIALKEALGKVRKTPTGDTAIAPVFILDQTFCPNVQFLGEGRTLSEVKAISYASGSKFPSGGKCTAGYCVGNQKAEALMQMVALHLSLCDNEATPYQYELLAEQLPSMNQRIAEAYKNTREFVNHIHTVLPAAKINFVSEELAKQGFTPSVFSLDLPTKGATDAEKEAHKRELNHKLIRMMITEIPEESKHCVSYGQLRGCYWTIPATSTQGTTKEGDKDYIARVAVSPDLDLDHHKKVFLDFVEQM